jgi:hypothetical protein
VVMTSSMAACAYGWGDQLSWSQKTEQ